MAATRIPWSGDMTAQPDPERTARTYEVRTYGCQMNVHDSERLSGLLEDAGYVGRAGRRAGADVVVFNTCAVRENADNRLYGNLGHLRPVKDAQPGHADRRRRLPGAEGPRRDRPARRPGSTSCSAPTTSARCRCCWSGPGTTTRRRSRSLESLEVFPSTLPTRRDSAYAGWVSISRRLQQHLHVLHRARRCAARRRTAGPATSSPRCEALVAEGVLEVTLLGQNVNSYGVEFGDRLRVRQAAAAPCGASRGAGAGPLHQPAPAGLHRRRDRGDGRDAQRLPPLHMPLQSGSDARAAGDAPLLPAGPLPRHHRPGPGGHAGRGDHHRHHRRLPRRDRGRLRSRPSTWCGQARFASAFTFQYSTRPGTPAADDGRPGAQGRSCRSATSGWSRLQDEISLGGEPGAGRPRPSRCWSPRARAARTPRTGRLSGRARDGRLVHFAPATPTAVRPGDVVDDRGHLRRAAPPGRRRAAAVAPPHPGRRRRRGRPRPATAGRPARHAADRAPPALAPAAGC